ncbi:esterase/lipase family protein [Rubrobacter indicoceani]|uniref:esterase/lipase family protein n=1 Tax=Rubrobacter indicoceani TaxID=2051957 RepID=UPI000E5AA2DB|nr:hypothetical protein [Rubrobacter indicoceani]
MESERRKDPLSNRPPVVVVGGFFSWPVHYRKMAAAIGELSGFPVHVVPLTPADWLAALFLGRTGQLVFEVATVIDKVLLDSPADRVILVGHSAGGIASRVCIGGTPPYGGRRYSGHRRVSHLITLGSPHLVGDSWPLGEIHRANELFPGALHENISYLSVAGAAVNGRESRRAARFYGRMTGDSDLPGDGIVPVQSALLPGSEHLVLNDLRHDQNGSHNWYGSDLATVARWWPAGLRGSRASGSPATAKGPA